MKYMARGGFERNSLMRLTLGLSLLFLAGFWVTNAVLYVSKMGLTPGGVVEYYRGSEASFRPPRSFLSMLEVTHAHLAMMAMVLLFVTHLSIFVPLRHPVKVGFIVVTFLSALAGEAAGWLVRFVSPAFASVKLGAFLALEICLGLLLLLLAFHLYREARRDRASRQQGGQETAATKGKSLHHPAPPESRAEQRQSRPNQQGVDYRPVLSR